MSNGTVNIPLMNGTKESNQLKDKYNKDNLVQYIQYLRNRNEELESYKLISQRVEMLERSQVRHLQYNRRESIEIHGIPENVKDDALEKSAVNILESIGVKNIKPYQIHACHRLKNKRNTVIRFTTRKFADGALHHRKHLREVKKEDLGFAEGTKLFINESLCPPMKFLHYKVRLAHKNKKIVGFNLWKGKLSLTVAGNDDSIVISHISDLVILGLAEQEDIERFFNYI